MVVKAFKAGQQYAIKIYSDSYLQQRGHNTCKAIDLYKLESTIISLIQHPQIPRYIDSFYADGMYFLVQDFLPGDTLGSKIEQGYQFSEDQVKLLILDLLWLLEFLHTSTANKPAVIHRDIRLSNLITMDNDLFLIDFGLAARLANKDDEKLINTWFLSKNLFSDSPTYAANRRDFSVSSDLFGVGIVAVDLFTNSVVGEMANPWEQSIPVSQPFILFVRRLLGREGRFASCKDALNQLRSIM